MAVHRGDVGAIQKALTDYELKAQEMNVGVNYMALDDERRRQEHLLRELRDLEEEIASLNLNNTELPHLASIVGAELSYNTKCLQYLTGISELERSIGEVATHFAERSVKLSDPTTLHKNIVTYKTLTDNVKSCWTYVDQLATLAQIHLKTAAEYHQFYYEANEIEAKLEKQLMIAQKAHHSATMRRSHKEATKVANEIREQLNVMQSLWQRSKNLVKRSETIVPIRLRLGGVAKGVAIRDPSNRPVMVKAMVSLTGPDYKIQKGEHLQLIDNRQDSHLWRVQTSSGIVEVPSVCFWLTDTDSEATERAIRQASLLNVIKQLCKKTWLEVINLISLRLYEVYVDLLQHFNSQEVVCSHEEALNMLIADLQRQLISTVGQDGRLQSEVNTFQKGVIITKRLERLQSGDINLREPDIVQIRAPLLRLQDHLMAVDQMQQEMKLLNDHIADYLSEIDNERWQIAHNLDHLNRLTKQSEQQLNDMIRKMDLLKTQHERRLYQQSPGRLKVQPLIIPEQKEQPKRSRSQPRMTVVNAISSSTASSDSEPTSDPYIRSGGRRTKSQVMYLDAMVQIGSKSKSAETQHQDGRIEAGRRISQEHKSVQLDSTQPLKLAAQTQIGYSVIDGGVQVDTSSLESYNLLIKHDTSKKRSRSLTPSSEDDEGHEYITEVAAAASLQATANKGKRRYTAAAQSGPLSKRKSSSLTSLVHSCTQLGLVTTDKAVSPVQELDTTQSCPYCHSKILLSSQTQIGEIYSGSEKYQYYQNCEVNSESSSRQHRVSKKVQSGYPCLTDRANLYCQCDVLGPITSNEGTEVASTPYQRAVSSEQFKMNSYAQIGVLYSNARQQAGISDNDVLSASTQVGIVNRDHYQKRHIMHERRSGQAQTRPRSMQELSSFSGVKEYLPYEENKYVTAVSMRPHAANSSTQIGSILSGGSVQANKPNNSGVISKRSQVGYSHLGRRSHSYTQLGQLCQQAGIQKGHVEINVEPDMMPIAQVPTSMQQSAPPSKDHRNAMSVQVTRKLYDDTTQISHVLSHDEVQTQNLPNFAIRQQQLQVYDVHRHKPRRSSSVPSIQFSTETQVGPVVIHENLSPIAMNGYVTTIRPAEMVNALATPKTMRSKRIQSVSIPSARHVEMQIGQLLQESGTQSLADFDNFEETPIAPTLLSVQQKAISMPDVGVAEAQIHPTLHGKKLQVSIAMDVPSCEKKHNKKLQVSVVPSKEMYDVQVETMPFLQKEHFDVSCDAMIQQIKIPKKVQVSMMESNPEIPMTVNQGPVYASMPSQSPVEAIPLVQPEMALQVRSAPPSRLIDAACEAITDAKYFDANCQCDDFKPMTMGKKLQVELGGQMTTSDKTSVACDSSDLVKTVGKKLQVEINGLNQTTSKTMQDETCTTLNEIKMYDASQQTAIIDEPPPIFTQATSQPVYSAPPMPQNVNMCDTACEALRNESACDGFTQSEKVRGVGKKLQVAIEIEDPIKSVYEIVSMQAYSKDTFVSLSEPVRMEPVHAAAPSKPDVSTEDRECEALSRNDFFDASVQSVEVTPPKPNVLGKKLQVSLPNLTTSTIQVEQRSIEKPLGFPKAIQTDGFHPEPAPQLVPLQEAPKVYSAPPLSQPRTSTEDRSCDATANVSTFDAAVQAPGTPKPESFGKKLQVDLVPLVIMGSQSTVEVQPPTQPIYLENAAKVFSAPPPLEKPKVQTEDKFCDAMTIPVFDAGVQIAGQEKPEATVVGKKLQVTPPSLSLVTAQTMIEQSPPQVIKVDEVSKVFSAPPMPSQTKVQMDDKSCDALDSATLFDAGVQAAEIQAPKTAGVGKKLQVAPPALAVVSLQCVGAIATPEKPHVVLEVSGVQTIQEPAVTIPSQVVRVEESSRVFAAPPPKPSIQTEDKSCDALDSATLFDAGVQAAEIKAPKATIVGKKLQVVPPALAVISSQGTGVIATPEKPHVVLEVSGVQTIQEPAVAIPSQVVRVEESSRVFAAPPPKPSIQTEDKSCDALDSATLFDAGVQAAEIQAPKAASVGKKLQVAPPALAVVSLQCVGAIATPEKPHVVLEVSGVQTIQEPAVTIPSQVVRVEESSRVFAAPPPKLSIQTEDKSCDALDSATLFDAGVQAAEIQAPKAASVGKKLQVAPPALAVVSSQCVGAIATPEKPHVVLEVSGVQTIQEPAVAIPSQVVRVEESSKVFAAPPPKPSIQTEDKSCDALDSATLFDAGVQAAEIQAPKTAGVGKKLQVAPPALAVVSLQCVGAIATPEKPHVVLEVSGVQTIQEPAVAIPSQVVRVEESSKVFAAPPPKPSIQTEDKSCDALDSATLFDAGVQAAEIQAPKTAGVGKKLQVAPPALAVVSSQGTGVIATPEKPHVVLEVSGVQTIQEPAVAIPSQVVRVEESSKVFAAPPPKPSIQTEDKSCDALDSISLFNASVQVEDILKNKPKIVGKKLQVSSSAFAPVKPMVMDEGIQLPSITLETSLVQCSIKDASTPFQSIHVEESNKVFAAPPPASQVTRTDRACEAMEKVSMFDSGIQVSELPLMKPDAVGKKLQVSPAPYSVLSVQTTELLPSEAAKPVAQGKKLQVSPPPLVVSYVQSTLQIESVPQSPIVQTELASKVFAAPPPPPKTVTVDTGNDALEAGQLFDASTQSSPVVFADALESPKKPLAYGKKLQADLRADLVESKVQVPGLMKLNVVCVQTKSDLTRILATNDMSTQADYVQQHEKRATFGKKMQVDMRPPMNEKSEQTQLPYPLEVTTMHTVSDTPIPAMVVQPVRESAPVYSAPPKPTTEDRGLDAQPLPQMCITITQTDTLKPTVSFVQSTFLQSEAPTSKAQTRDFSCSSLPKMTNEVTSHLEEEAKFGKSMQVVPLAMEIGLSQTTWQEATAPPIIGVKEATVVRSAPPLPSKPSVKDAAIDSMLSKPCSNAFTQIQAIPTYGKKMQVMPPPLSSCSCQAAPIETFMSSPIVESREDSVKVFAAPPVKMPTKEDKACEPMFKIPVSDASLQYDAPMQKPPSRSVRIQKGVGAFEGLRAIGIQYSSPEPRRSPLSPLLARAGTGIEWGVQVEPTTLVGTTQTPPMETSVIFTSSKPDVYSRTTQVDLEQQAPVMQTSLLLSAPIQTRQPQNLFSFVRETKAKVPSRRSRSGSQGLIPYKTQVFSPSNSLSVSVPAMLNVRTDVTSPATITDCYGYSSRVPASQLPRRYAHRFRTPSGRGTYDRRNKSMENIYFRSSRTIPRHYISDSDLTMGNRRMLQQTELEERCEECITQCVRLIGYDKVAQMLMDTRTYGEFGRYRDLEIESRRRRLQNARTQYTSTTAIGCPYCCQSSVREGEDRARWPSGAGEEEFYSGEDGGEWDSMQSSYGSTKHGSYRWISRTPVIRAMQTEPTSDEVDQLMKNRALSAYCSDYELQQSGINANFEENSAFTFVAWKTDEEGEDKLELDTVGNLLKLTLVGARVPGTGEVISAADAFYRGILRVIYMDDERGAILPLTTAINANAVIVEKRFSTGVGIAFHYSPRKYPVECSAVWQTPNMRRRTYRVNYIRLNDRERVPVRRALEQGIIDKYSGEIVGVRELPKAEMGDPLLQMRESSVGSGDTMARRQHPERFNIREAILNDVISVDLIQPEIILLPDSEMDSATHSRRREGSVSASTESNSDLEV